MKAIVAIFYLLVLFSCDKNNADVPTQIEVKIGEPFTIATPAEVTVLDNGLVFTIEKVSDYITYGIVAPEVHTTVQLTDVSHTLSHQLICENQPCAARQIGPNSFAEEVPLNNHLKLRFLKITKSTVLVNHGPGKDKVRPDSAKFIIVGNGQ